MENPEYIFLIYSCYKNIEKAKLVYNYLISNNFQQCCKYIYIIYGNPSRAEFQENNQLEDRKSYILEESFYIVLNTPDDYYSLNQKTLCLFRVILELHPKLSGIFKCDDDVIPNINHLSKLIFLSKFINVDYCGNKVDNKIEFMYNFHGNSNYYVSFPVVRYCGGPLYYLSYKALETFKKINNMETVKLFLAEDIMVGYHLNHSNIEPSTNINALYSDNEYEWKILSFHNYKHENKYLKYLKNTNIPLYPKPISHEIPPAKQKPLGLLCPEINGGLGNQLFKIGAALSIAREYNRELIISKAHFIPNSHQSAEKTMQSLDKLFNDSNNKFSISLRIINDNIPNRYVYKAKDTESFEYVDLSTRITKDIIEGCVNIILYGYFINPRYLPDDYPDFISINPTRKKIQILNEYENFKNSYFIHIRLGDYVGNELYNISLESYYLDCIARIKSYNPKAIFIVCTNEYSQHLQKYLKQIQKNADIKIQSNKDDELDTLFIMSQCQGGICSNSTLSWFGVYLQQSRINAVSPLEASKYIYMPYPWVNKTFHGFTDENTSDIYPEWASVYNTHTNAFRNI